MTDNRGSHTAELITLTSAKIAGNTALRWVGPFLPVLERAFGAGTGTLTAIMGGAELAGVSTAASGSLLDRGYERRMFLAGLSAVLISSLIALTGTLTGFAISFALLVLGISHVTIAGHAWIGRRTAFDVRSRAIGAFELSWALSLLVGAPLIAGALALFGWRGAYLTLAAAAGVSILAVRSGVRADDATARSTERRRARLPSTAWPPMIASASSAIAGLGIFVVSGTWLSDTHAVPTGGLGAVATLLGLVELVSSGSVARAGDRIGARRSVALGLGLLGIGVVTLMTLGAHLALAILGLLAVVGGFEFAFVSSLTLVTEAAPRARGRAIGISSAMGTVARAIGVAASGQLYDRFGIVGSGALALAATMVAATATAATRLHE